MLLLSFLVLRTACLLEFYLKEYYFLFVLPFVVQVLLLQKPVWRVKDIHSVVMLHIDKPVICLRRIYHHSQAPENRDKENWWWRLSYKFWTLRDGDKTTQLPNQQINQPIFHFLLRRSRGDKNVDSFSLWLSELCILCCFYSFLTDTKKSCIRIEYE